MLTSLCRSMFFILLTSVSCLPAGNAENIAFTDATIVEVNHAIDAGTLNAEKLVELSLARIARYDHTGPALNAVLHVNENALEEARALDRERIATGRRSPLHGIPVVLKDNFDTAALPTTAGSFMLKGSLPPDDAFLVTRLKEAGAIILAKLNMSEFASGDAMSSLGGATYNPHDLSRSPSGSSGGSGVAIAAGYAMIGLGTDTGGSVRGPSSANGIVGLKPTHGLLSRDGIIPLALSFDTAGPMARSVSDIALALDILAGKDPADPATAKSEGQVPSSYTQFLDATALDGARIGVARDFMGSDKEVDWVMEASLQTMRDAGAEIVDVEFPSWLLDARGRFYRAIRYREFRAQIRDYLATTDPQYPKSLEALVTRSMTLTAPRQDDVIPNPSRWKLMQAEVKSGDLTDFEYVSVRDHALPLIRGVVNGLMTQNTLDAIVYPTSPVRPTRIDRDPDPDGAPGSGSSAVIIANLTGFPDLIVPAGFTGRGLPVTLSFLGPAFSEPKLLALGYAFEQLTHARRLPASTPPLAGETLSAGDGEPTYDPEARLRELGITLPAAPDPVANYVNGVQKGDLIFLAGKGPKRADGSEIHGKLGDTVSIEQGYEAARITAINQLAVLKAMLGDLSRVKRVVKVLGMVNSDPDFIEQPAVINGFSDLIVEVFGERGRHARAAVGMASLPRGQSVEIEMIVEIQSTR